MAAFLTPLHDKTSLRTCQAFLVGISSTADRYADYIKIHSAREFSGQFNTHHEAAIIAVSKYHDWMQNKPNGVRHSRLCPKTPKGD
jgi:hypothetical protein